MGEEFIKERNEALLSLDKDKIMEYGKKYNVKFPKDERIFWTGVHKAICNLYRIPSNGVSEEQYKKSCEWLSKHKFSESI